MDGLSRKKKPFETIVNINANFSGDRNLAISFIGYREEFSSCTYSTIKSCRFIESNIYMRNNNIVIH